MPGYLALLLAVAIPVLLALGILRFLYVQRQAARMRDVDEYDGEATGV